MRMFLGEYSPNITEGSRIALPKKLRHQINGDTVILSRGFEKCIFVYDKQDWVKEAQKQEESPISNKEMRDLKRYMYASAAEVDIDSQGRVVIPAALKKYAGISTKAMVVGAGDHFEVWEVSAWKERLEQISAELEE